MFAQQCELVVDCTAENVLDALEIWCIKPQVANRRLSGCTYLSQCNISFVKNDLSCCLSECKAIVGEQMFKELNELLSSFIKDDQTGKFIVRKLIPRCLEKYDTTTEAVAVLTNSVHVKAIFIPLCTLEHKTSLIEKSFVLEYNEKSSRLACATHTLFDDFDLHNTTKGLLATRQWLVKNLLQKIKAWSLASFESNKPLRKSQSISLVNIEEYTQLYTLLKKKYGPYFVEIWPESTDPLKFVYEDIAIATYLILIWKEERMKLGTEFKQSFVDLGCGNGLLVHILSSEGHPGKGMDVSSRKIWNMYGESTILEEKPLQPDFLTVTQDWIIGNHSDELTPWIPVIASRSSFLTRYFVLPCCFFDFYGKFHRTDQQNSQYHSYLEYINDIGTQCGFFVKEDTLRIPSTKRICQIGQIRTYNEKEQDSVLVGILNLIDINVRNTAVFVPRKESNDPKNCSSVDRLVKNNIISEVTKTLLKRKEKNSEVDKFSLNSFAVPSKEGLTMIGVPASEFVTTSGVLWSNWNPGGRIHLNELAELFDSETLNALKSQCGGLQTLLRNSRNIFKVVNGYVSLRDYRSPEDMSPSRKSKPMKVKPIKTRICWFYANHPHGCVLSKEQCTFAHGADDKKEECTFAHGTDDKKITF